MQRSFKNVFLDNLCGCRSTSMIHSQLTMSTVISQHYLLRLLLFMFPQNSGKTDILIEHGADTPSLDFLLLFVFRDKQMIKLRQTRFFCVCCSLCGAHHGTFTKRVLPSSTLDPDSTESYESIDPPDIAHLPFALTEGPPIYNHWECYISDIIALTSIWAMYTMYTHWVQYSLSPHTLIKSDCTVPVFTICDHIHKVLMMQPSNTQTTGSISKTSPMTNDMERLMRTIRCI